MSYGEWSIFIMWHVRIDIPHMPCRRNCNMWQFVEPHLHPVDHWWFTGHFSVARFFSCFTNLKKYTGKHAHKYWWNCVLNAKNMQQGDIQQSSLYCNCWMYYHTDKQCNNIRIWQYDKTVKCAFLDLVFMEISSECLSSQCSDKSRLQQPR